MLISTLILYWECHKNDQVCLKEKAKIVALNEYEAKKSDSDRLRDIREELREQNRLMQQLIDDEDSRERYRRRKEED